MPKAEIKALLLGVNPESPSPSLTSSPSSHTPALPTLSAALSHYKDSLVKVEEAKGRHRVLARQLEKQRSTTINAKRHGDYAQYIRQTADLDKCLLQWNQATRVRKQDQQSLLNRQSRQRIKNNIDHSRSFFHNQNMHRRDETKEESDFHERCLKEAQDEMASSHLKQRRAWRKEERQRQENIEAYHFRKQQQIRSQKQRQIRQLFSHSASNHGTVNQLVERNHSLKKRRYREEQAGRRANTNQLPINLASTIKNPEIYQ